MLLDAALITVPTLALTHVTYLNTYRDKAIEEWPHYRFRVWCTYVIYHNGRRVMWSVCTPLILVQRAAHRVTRKGGRLN